MGLDLFGRVSTDDDGSRSDFDFYETPRWATATLLHHHRAIIGASVFEPCSGRDAIAMILKQAGCEVLTNDLDPRQPSYFHEDATEMKMWTSMMTCGIGFKWAITNPSFDIAFDILKLAIQHAEDGAAFLLRKTFLEPTEERGRWLQEHPPTRCIGLPRHNFRGEGTDSVSCDWYIWEHRPDRTLAPFIVDAGAKLRRDW